MQKELWSSRSFCLWLRSFTIYIRQRICATMALHASQTLRDEVRGHHPHRTHTWNTPPPATTLPHKHTCSFSLCFPCTQAMSKISASAKKASTRAKNNFVLAASETSQSPPEAGRQHGGFPLFPNTRHVLSPLLTCSSTAGLRLNSSPSKGDRRGYASPHEPPLPLHAPPPSQTPSLSLL